MKKEIYCQAMDNIKMSDECLGAILDNIDEITDETTSNKKINHIKLIPFLTAAALFFCCGITVAAETGAFDWVKSFFNEQEIPEFYLENSGKMNNFKCESEFGLELSPVGVLGEGKDICCVFEIVNLPENMKFEQLNIGISNDIFNQYYEAHPENKGIFGGAECVPLNDENENLIGILARSDCDMFATGTEISFDVWPSFNNPLERVEFREKYGFDENEMCNIAKLSFTIETKESKEKVIDYSTYMCKDIPKRNYEFMFDEISITPLTINATGSRMFYGDETLGTSEMVLVFEDGSKLNLEKCSGWGGGYSGDGRCLSSIDSCNTTLEERALMYGEHHMTATWCFDKPVDHDTIAEIWFGEMRIYNSAEE